MFLLQLCYVSYIQMYTLNMYYVHFVIILFCIILIVNQCEGRYITYQLNGKKEANIDLGTSNSHTLSTFDTTNLLAKNVDKLYRTNKRHEKVDINEDAPPENAKGALLRCNTDEKKGSNESASKSGDSCNKQKPWSHGVFSDSNDKNDGYYCPTQSTWLSQESLIKTADPKSDANKWIGGDLLAEKCKKNNEYNCLKIQFACESGIASVDGWKICGGNSGKCDGRISQYIVLYRNPSSDQWSTFQEKGLASTPQTFSVEKSGVATETPEKQVIAQELMFCPLEATGSTPLLHVTVKGCILKKRDQANKTVVFPGKASDGVCTSEEVWLDMDGQLKACMFHTNAGGRASDAIFSRAGFSFPNIPLKLEQNDKYYLEVSFPELKAIKAIKVMGGTIGEVQGTVERFKLSYKDTANDGGWVFVQEGKCGADKFFGQRQPNSYASGYYKANRIPLKPPIVTTGIRLYPQTWCGDRPVTKVDFKACDVLAKKKCGCDIEEKEDVTCKTKPEPCARNAYVKTGFTNPMGGYKQLRGKGSSEVQYSVGSQHTLSEKSPLEKLDQYSVFSHNADKQSMFEYEPHLQNELHHYLDKSRLAKPKTIEDNDVTNYYSNIAKRNQVLNYQLLRDQREEQNQLDGISLHEPRNGYKKFEKYPTDIVKRDTSYVSPLGDTEEIHYLSESHPEWLKDPQEDRIGDNADVAKYVTAHHLPTFENQESEANGHQESHLQDGIQFKQRRSDSNVAPFTDHETIENESCLDEEVSFATNNMDGIRTDELNNDWHSNKMHSTDTNQAKIFDAESSIEDEPRGEYLYSVDQKLEARNIDPRTSGESSNLNSDYWHDINEEEATAREYRMERPDVGMNSIDKHTNLIEKANDDLNNMAKQEQYENEPSLKESEHGGPNNFFEEDNDDPKQICYEEESEDESSLEDADAYDYGESINLCEDAIDDSDRIVKREVSEQLLDKNENVQSSNTIESINNNADKTSIQEGSESKSFLEDAEGNQNDMQSNLNEKDNDSEEINNGENSDESQLEDIEATDNDKFTNLIKEKKEDFDEMDQPVESENESPLEDTDDVTNQDANVLDKLSNVQESGTEDTDKSMKGEVMTNVVDKELKKVHKDKTKRASRGAFMKNDANLNPPMVSDGETVQFTDEQPVEDSNASSGGTDDLIIIPMKYARNTDIRNLMNEIQEALLKTDA